MKRKSLLMMLLVALFVPLAMDAQTRTHKRSVVGSVELEMTASAKEMSSFPLLTKVESLREAALEEINGRGVRADNELLTEGFESMSSISTSYSATGWYAYNAGSGNNWTLNSSSNYANSGSKSAQVKYSSSYAANCYLVSAPFTVSSNMSELTVSLYERVRGYTETFEVFFVKASDVTTLAGVASATKYNAIASASYTNTTYAQQSGTVTNSALAGQSVRVVVHCTSAADQWYLYIDDITVTETEEETCPKPTDLNVTNITNNSATLNWTSEAGSYNVQYRIPGSDGDAVFFDDFENGLDNWTTYTEGDAPAWRVTDPSSGLSWSGHNGSTYVAISMSWNNSAYTADNWLVTPQLDLGGTLKFYVYTNQSYPDDYEVKLSTGGNAVRDFTVTLQELASIPTTGDWVEVSIDLSRYAGQRGYIAIHHSFYDGNYILVDDFGVYQEGSEPGPWIPATPNGNSANLTGLNPETTYEWQVMADCGSDGQSLWSDIATFTTLDACAAPTGLSADALTNSATLSWTGYADAYNIQYREVDPTAPATVILTAGDIWGDGSGYQMLLDADATAFGTIIPETGPLTSSGNASASTYAEFEYKIPTNADGSLTTTNIVVNNSISIQIPAGTYDWCITNPAAGDRMWIAGVNGRYDDFVFEAGKTYEFSMQLFGENDGAALTVTADWTSVSGTVISPYTLTGLNPGTTYEWQVKGDGCDDWSAGNSFTTLDGILVESISADDVEVVVGGTANITNLVVLPADATNPAVTYTSNDEAIATVDANGVVTGVAVGETTITIAATDGSNVSTTIDVTVNGIDVTGITAEDVTVVNGETATISYTVAPENATDASVTFTSADETIATVENGVVTGVAVGETTITIASVSNPEVTTEITVTVTSNPNAVQFTVNAPATAHPGDVITVGGVLTAPTNGTYGGFNGLILNLVYDNTAFEYVANSMTYGPVVEAAQQLGGFLYPSTTTNAVQLAISVFNEGSFVTAEGVVFSAQFRVLAETGEFDFTAEPNGTDNFDHEGTSILYEATPSTVEITGPETYTKTIVGWDTYDNPDASGWYLIASPIDEVAPSNVDNMIADPAENYDLFSFDQTQQNEWQNYKKGRFPTLEPGKGYLYANKNTVDLIFTGYAYTDEGTFPLVYSEDNPDDSFMYGWNLMGNPYAESASVDRPYYTLNGVFEYELAEEDEPVEPMEGIFVHVTKAEYNANQYVTFTPVSKQQQGGSKGSSLTLNLNKGGKLLDRAIISFSQGHTLPKFQFDRNHTKVYIPQDGQDYAIVRGEEMGEMPVNFKAENDGTYSLSFSSRNAEFAYLHLIDNMTGKDIDLLQTQSYSFEARTTDYESRFKLVFATGDNSKDDNFAFFSNGSFIINNEGEATLQVIDVTGRILKSASINGCTNVNVNAASGIYMLRLVNGDNVKVQKVVVK